MLKGQKLYSLLDQLAGSGVGFLSLLILARILPAEDLGNWVVYTSCIALSEMLKHGLLQTAVVQKLASAESSKEKYDIIGATWFLVLMSAPVSLAIAGFGYVLSLSFNIAEGWRQYFFWYPILNLILIPFNISWWIQTATSKMQWVFATRTVYVLTLFFGIIISYFLLSQPLGFESIVILQLGSYAAASLLTLVTGWCYPRLILHRSKKAIRELLLFGKFNLGTLIFGNLLKTIDIYLISGFMGPAQVAIYALPLRLLNLFEIPLKSLTSTSLPIIARLRVENKVSQIKHHIFRRAFKLSLLYLPAIIIGLIFPVSIMTLMGGEKYASSAGIWMVFLGYLLLLPFDRFLGLALDGIGQPQKNLRKVMIMLTINTIGNLIVLGLDLGLEAIAAVTVVTIIAGIITGSLQLLRISDEGDKSVSFNRSHLKFYFHHSINILQKT